MGQWNVGDILYGSLPNHGRAMLAVCSPPLLCPTCGKTVEADETGDDNRCPHCGNPMDGAARRPCRCGDNDLVSIVVCANDNFGQLRGTNEVIPYNSKVNLVYHICAKDVDDAIRTGAVRLCSRQEAAYRLRMLYWTMDREYEPGREVPQRIKDQFPE